MKPNVMDNMTNKEREEKMGLSEGQKSSLRAVGLSADEVRFIHDARVAKSIQEEREELGKLEKKLNNRKLNLVFSSFLEGTKEDETSGDETDLEPIFTNEEANKIIAMEVEKLEGFKEADAEFMDAAMDTDAEDYGEKGSRLAKAAGRVVDVIAPIVDKVQRRRWKGYEIADKQWHENGEKGTPPESWSGVYTLPILVYYNYLK